VDGGEGKEMKRCPQGANIAGKRKQRKCDGAGKNGKMKGRGILTRGGKEEGEGQQLKKVTRYRMRRTYWEKKRKDRGHVPC
jgi:hypothetical protein